MIQSDQESCERIATDFVKFYYNELNLHEFNKITNLYKEHSISSFQEEKLCGNPSIINKLTTLFSQGINYNIKHMFVHLFYPWVII